MKKIVGLGLICLMAVLGWVATEAVSLEILAANYSDLKLTIDQSKPLALLVFGVLYCLCVALSLPIATLLTLGGAAIFGWIGVIPIWLGATGGAVIVFVAVRFFFAQWAQRTLDQSLRRFRGAFLAHPFRWALSMRLIPVVPFWVANALPALLGMRLGSFVLSTGLGILPGTLIYVSVGVGFDAFFSQGGVPSLETLSSPKVWGPLLALGGLIGMSTFFGQRKEREVHDKTI